MRGCELGKWRGRVFWVEGIASVKVWVSRISLGIESNMVGVWGY